MTPERQKIIDKIHQISDWSIKGIFLVGLIVLFLKPGNWFWWVSGILLGLAILVNAVSGIWATDEEKEEFKRTVKEAMQEIKAEEDSKPKRTIFSPDEVKIPLKGLTPEQISVVHKLLQSISEQNGHIKTSDLVQFLRALKGQGDLDDSDMQRVIGWVEYVTKKSIDERNFKYDYDNKYSEKGVVKWGNKIRAEYDKIEIS